MTTTMTMKACDYYDYIITLTVTGDHYILIPRQSQIHHTSHEIQQKPSKVEQSRDYVYFFG